MMDSHLLSMLMEGNKAEFIANKQGPALLHAYSQDEGKKPKAKTAEDIISILQKMDPSNNEEFAKANKMGSNNFLQWLANRYAKNEFSMEDRNRVKSDLEEFTRVRPKLENKDINAYDMKKLLAAMDSFKGKEVSTRNARKWTPEQEEMFKDGDAKLVYQDDDIAVVIPKTQDASCEFGSGTRWCTTQRGTSHHTSYSKQGPLYIVFFPGGKHQFHFETGQFMNEQDLKAELGPLVDKYPKISEVFHELAEKHGTLGLLKNPSDKAMMAAVQKHPEKIKDIQPKRLTKEIVNAAVSNSSEYNVKDIFGYTMKVRPDLVDEETRMAVLTAAPDTIKSIAPKELKQDQVFAALRSKNAAGAVEAFKYVEGARPDLINDESRVYVLVRDGRLLKTVGKKATPRMVHAALNDSETSHALDALAFAMKEMPEKVTDADIVNLVKQSRFALQHIPAKRQTEEIINAALNADAGAFEFVANPSDAALETAMMSGPYMMKLMKKHHGRLTTDMFKRMAETAGRKLIGELEMFEGGKHIPPHVDIDQVYEAALSKHPEALQMIPPAKQKERWILAAVKANPKVIKYANKAIVAKNPTLKKLAAGK